MAARPSPLAETLASVGDRWALLLVAALGERPRRFNDLLEELPGLSPNILSARLRALEGDALVVARPYSERPPRFVYELSTAGRELAEALRPLIDWGVRHTGDREPPRHSVCGTALETRWYCPTCDEAVDGGEQEELDFA